MRTHPRSRQLAAPLFGAVLVLVSFMPAAPGLVSVVAEQDSAAIETNKAAKLYTTSCIACHLPPDPDIMTDRSWLSQVSDTAWSSTPKKARAALIEYLKSKPLALPTTISTDEPMTKGQGTVTSSITNGELLLVDEGGKSFRLVWSTDGKSDPQPRALPAGKYKLRNYRIKLDQKRTPWHISATAPAIQNLEVRPGKNLEVKIDPRITITSKVNGRMGGMNIVGDHGAGLSIYRKEKRIPIEYRLVDSYGETLAKGNMKYGWGGGGWTPLESYDQDVALELIYAIPPFEVIEK